LSLKASYLETGPIKRGEGLKRLESIKDIREGISEYV